MKSSPLISPRRFNIGVWTGDCKIVRKDLIEVLLETLLSFYTTIWRYFQVISPINFFRSVQYWFHLFGYNDFEIILTVSGVIPHGPPPRVDRTKRSFYRQCPFQTDSPGRSFNCRRKLLGTL